MLLERPQLNSWRFNEVRKTAKKKVKAVARALKYVNSTPKTPGRRKPAEFFSSTSHQIPVNGRSPIDGASFMDASGSSRTYAGGTQIGSERDKNGSATSDTWPSRNSPRGLSDVEESPGRFNGLMSPSDDSRFIRNSGTLTNYGSIRSSPPSRQSPIGAPALELPDPALSPNTENFPRNNRAWRQSKNVEDNPPQVRRAASVAGDAYEVGRTHTPSKLNANFLPKHRGFFRPKRTVSTPDGANPVRSPLLRRVFSRAGTDTPSSADFPLEAYKEFDFRQADFFNYLDKELGKIESFYKTKEVEASERLGVLRQQLHEMRDRRLDEVLTAQRAKRAREEQERAAALNGQEQQHSSDSNDHPSHNRWAASLEHMVSIGHQRFGKNTKALTEMGSPPKLLPTESERHQRVESWQDFVRRPGHENDVPYRSAKRKLKVALQEFYRGLELLKSYALLNRTAFRKINKKYDKAINARPTGRYMAEKVSKSWFVQSEVLDGHLVAVEDLYARYFERGNHKIAVGKLRSKHPHNEDFNASVFRNGLLLAGGFVFGVQGIVYGSELLKNFDPVVRLNTSYLLQIYAGYFLILFLFLLFCIDCRIWSLAKINYMFVFEFDTRHNLDWRQLSELPSFFFFLLGVILWLNFLPTASTTGSMFIYWPVVLVGVSVLILFMPGPVIYHRSRKWFAYSNFRLLLAGWYPVEFRDFFLGDMYCSQTYALGNLELFFCLYAQHWSDPGQCNSTHSRLLGFFTTVPGIIRALQCIRRYIDTRNAFPHLVNCGKYTFTILFYMSLSIWRIDEAVSYQALFITFGTVNAIYCSVWDLAMDWSLLNPYAKNRFLRDVLGYKHPWVYYLAMIIDPILRFNWVFYAILPQDAQHSALLSFFISFSEICRRGMWTLFRVENEHCTNVGRFRASRDVPLPYEVPPHLIRAGDEPEGPKVSIHGPAPATPDIMPATTTTPTSRPHAASGADVEAMPAVGAGTPAADSLRRRKTLSDPPTPMQRGIARVGTMMAQAHAQDFERKRPPAPDRQQSSSHLHPRNGGVNDDDDDDAKANSSDEYGDEDEDQATEQDILDAEGILERHRSATVEF